MKKRKQYAILSTITYVLFMLTGNGFSANNVVVIPLNSLEGNAATSDVVKGKIFSSRAAGKGTMPFVASVGSDGNLQKGSIWPNPRFTDNGNGTVTDNLTALVCRFMQYL